MLISEIFGSSLRSSGKGMLTANKTSARSAASCSDEEAPLLLLELEEGEVGAALLELALAGLGAELEELEEEGVGVELLPCVGVASFTTLAAKRNRVVRL